MMERPKRNEDKSPEERVEELMNDVHNSLEYWRGKGLGAK